MTLFRALIDGVYLFDETDIYSATWKFIWKFEDAMKVYLNRGISIEILSLFLRQSNYQ